MDFVTKLKSFDAYPKLNEEFKVRTLGGAIVSICAIIVILILFISELALYFHVERVDHLYVDVSRGEKLRINFDVTFPQIPCSLLSLDAMDVSGSHQLGVDHHIKKKPLNAAGQPIGEEMTLKLGEQLSEADMKLMKQSAARAESGAIEDITKDPQYCGPCYGAEMSPGQCCRTCDDVKAAYNLRNWAVPPLVTIEQCVAQGQTVDPSQTELTEHQGCQMYGYLEVNKVAGNFHFAPGKSYQRQNVHFHDLAQFQSVRFNVSHRIDHLSFGESYPGQVNPLDQSSKEQPALERGLDESLPEPSDSGGMFMYYCKIVPTTYSYLHSFSQLVTNQFSVTEHYRLTSARDGQGLPGVFFFYELSPIMVSISERRMGLLHFLTQLCAILGGVFTVAGMIDRLVYSSLRSFEKKLTLNKVS